MPKTLLLADDSVVIQKLVGLSFANEDIELVTVDNGDDAVVRAREIGPDLVLADVVMPGKSGYEVCEAIKSDAQLGQTPVLLLTGTFEAFDEARAQAAGADGQITKPFEAQALVERVNELLAAAGQPAAAPPASEAPDFFDDNTGAMPQAVESPPAAPDVDFAFPSESALSSDPLGSLDGLSDLDLPPAADLPAGAPDVLQPASGLPGGDETIAIMPGSVDDHLANTADMPMPLPDMPAIPTNLDADLGATVLATDDFATPPAPPSPPIPAFDSFKNLETAPQPATPSVLEAPAQQAEPIPEVTPPPASPQPPPIPADPAETILAEDLFAGAPPLSESPAADMEAASSASLSGLDLDLDATRGGEAGGAPTSFVPDNVDEYAVSSSDLGPSPEVNGPDWASMPASEAGGPAEVNPAPAWPAETATDDSEPLFGTGPTGPVADPMADFAREPSGSEESAASSSPLEAPLGRPEPVQNADWPLAEEPVTQVEGSGAGRVPQPMPSAAGDSGQDPGTSAALIGGKPDLSPMLRDRVHDTLEKVAWEAFSDLSETVVRQILQRVEEIAWEVIPQMTEAMVREEIRRMKGADEEES